MLGSTAITEQSALKFKATSALVVMGFSCNNSSVYTRPSEAV